MDDLKCDLFEDYLAGDLSEAQRAGFEAHLSDCGDCRRELGRQKQLDRLLVRGVEQIEPVPSSMIDRIEQNIRHSRRRRTMRLACGLSAATVVVVLALGFWLTRANIVAPSMPGPLARQSPEPTTIVQPVDHPAPEALPAKSLVRVSMANPSDAILRSLPSESEDVSVVWIYPTVKRLPAISGPGSD